MILRKWLIASAVLAIIFVGVLYASAPAIKAEVRKRTEAYLQARFQSDIEFSHFDVFLMPHPQVTIDNLTLRLQGRTDVAPLIEIAHLRFGASIWDLLRKRYTIRSVELDGLQIHMPPKNQGRPKFHATNADLARKYPVLIREIHADNASLSILRSDPSKPPREFPIHDLEIKDFSFDNPASFQALLTNPIPKGEIDCAGNFGPWDAEEPRHTPVSAQYTFSNADMSTLKGLSGTLHSTGKFSGPLDYLNVEGVTDVSDFALRMSDHPVALHTDYKAIVNGTNGNVTLKPVIARFRNTVLIVNGEVADLTPAKGRTILLDTVSQQARIEDLLFLTVKNEPALMTGPASVNAKLDIGEGDLDILQRMTIDGQFAVDGAHFSSNTVQQKLDSLSRRGQGHPQDKDIDNVVSNLTANFHLAKGVVDFSKLSFSVPGAGVALEGSYNLDAGEMDFHGKLFLQAKLSQTTTGTKSILLKAVDPFFKGKNGGTEVPIKIGGTKDHPTFGLDFHHSDQQNNK
ncbi:MAG: AsmA-like C-terminal region-containing protein [Candidatus Acidiferrales bacterium]